MLLNINVLLIKNSCDDEAYDSKIYLTQCLGVSMAMGTRTHRLYLYIYIKRVIITSSVSAAGTIFQSLELKLNMQLYTVSLVIKNKQKTNTQFYLK